MKASNRSGTFLLVFTLIAMVGCNGGSPTEGTGTLSLALTDSSCSGFKAIYVTIDEVQVKINNNSPNGNGGWYSIAKPMKTYNLLKLVNGISEVLGENELEAGTYQQLRLIIGKNPESANNINGEAHPDANYVVLIDDSYELLKIPSGSQTGVKLVHTFDIVEGSFSELMLDFEACKSIVETGSGKFLLKPTIKVIETANKYAVYGTVTAANDTELSTPIINCLVSAQISDGLSTSVVRSTLTTGFAGEEGQYSILLSPGQAYNIVAYYDGKVTESEKQWKYQPGCMKVTIPSNDNIEQNFELEKDEFGTINGTVKVNGTINIDDPPVVYINFYSELPCGYGQVTSLSMSPDSEGDITFSIELPLGTYDIVASSQGLVPDTEVDKSLETSGHVIDVTLEL